MGGGVAYDITQIVCYVGGGVEYNYMATRLYDSRR